MLLLRCLKRTAGRGVDALGDTPAARVEPRFEVAIWPVPRLLVRRESLLRCVRFVVGVEGVESVFRLYARPSVRRSRYAFRVFDCWLPL